VLFFLPCLLATCALPTCATLDAIGITALRRFAPELTGAGISVAQVEVSSPGWQANPAAIGPMLCKMTWTCGSGSATNFPNTLGSESGHANEVGRLFFSAACGVTQFENYEASYFTSVVIPNEVPIIAKIVNQSFTYFARNTRVDQSYDNYASKYNVLFVSGAGNSGWGRSPGTAYNGLSVAAYGGASSVGPATDGRAKPDITVPASATSFSTPLVSAAAALLMQAGVSDIRLLKALLLNGAQKPADWTNSATSPLDQRYGAGVLNVFNSWRQLRGGRQMPEAPITSRRGWALITIAGGIRHGYSFDVDRSRSFTATLVWLRNYGCTNINNLDLLLKTVAGELVSRADSSVDNVEHVHVPNLLPGSYVLEVSSAPEETYAMAFDIASVPPRLTRWTLVGEPEQPYLIESMTDLRAWSPWLTNVTSVKGVFEFAVETDGPIRFFRAIELP
jgi:hypothetical protein